MLVSNNSFGPRLAAKADSHRLWPTEAGPFADVKIVLAERNDCPGVIECLVDQAHRKLFVALFPASSIAYDLVVMITHLRHKAYLIGKNEHFDPHLTPGAPCLAS